MGRRLGGDREGREKPGQAAYFHDFHATKTLKQFKPIRYFPLLQLPGSALHVAIEGTGQQSCSHLT